MKKPFLTALVLMLSLSAFSQKDCLKLTKTQAYSGTVMTSLIDKIRVIQSPGQGIDIDLIHGSNLMMNISPASADIKCVGTNGVMDVYFEDGTRLPLTHMGKMNCEGNFSVFFGEAFQNAGEMKQLQTKKIRMLSIGYAEVIDGKVVPDVQDFILRDEQADAFMNVFNCLSKI